MKTYLIPAECHNAFRFPSIHFKGNDHFRFEVQLDCSMRYRLLDSENQYDINKIYGYGFGFNHHWNSIRIGWTWNLHTKKVDVYAYCYNEGVRDYSLIHSCGCAAKLMFDINRVKFAEGYKWVIVIVENNISYTKYVDAPINPANWGFRLFPYFGGQDTAPHDIEIKIKELI